MTDERERAGAGTATHGGAGDAGRERAAGKPPAGCAAPSRSRLRCLRLPPVRRPAAAGRFPYADLFFRFDPLAAFGTMLAARAWLPHLALALVTLGLTLMVGRIWCGWICPMGTLLGWFRFRIAGRRAARVPERLRGVKYVLLGAIVTMAALGNLTLMVLDPIALITRTFTTSLIPGLDYVVTAVETQLLSWGDGGDGSSG